VAKDGKYLLWLSPPSANDRLINSLRHHFHFR
jgi:hypothetical protein